MSILISEKYNKFKKIKKWKNKRKKIQRNQCQNLQRNQNLIKGKIPCKEKKTKSV